MNAFSQPTHSTTFDYFASLLTSPEVRHAPMLRFVDAGRTHRIAGIKRSPSGSYLLALVDSDYTVVEINPKWIADVGFTEIAAFDTLKQHVVVFTN